jgi:hypothetical protein
MTSFPFLSMRLLIGARLLSLWFPQTVAYGQTEASNRPNILVILVDDLGYGDLSGQGYAKDIQTPHIDRIFNDGMTFRNMKRSRNPSTSGKPMTER